MKKISDLLNNDDLALDQIEKEKRSIDDRTGEVIDRLFVRLCGIFPAFRQAWPTQTEYNSGKYEWTQAFINAKLNDLNKIKLGIDRFAQLHKPFVPTPGQFIAMCMNTNKEEKCNIPLYMPKRGDVRDEKSVEIAKSSLSDLLKKLKGYNN